MPYLLPTTVEDPDEKHPSTLADTQHADSALPLPIFPSTPTMADYLNHPFFALGGVFEHCVNDKQQQDGKTDGGGSESSHVERDYINGWACTDYFAAISMLDSSIWIIYNAWDELSHWDLEDPAEWPNGGEDEQPLPTRGRFKPEWDLHWARLARQPHERRRLMAKFLTTCALGTRSQKKCHWCSASLTFHLAVSPWLSMRAFAKTGQSPLPWMFAQPSSSAC